MTNTKYPALNFPIQGLLVKNKCMWAKLLWPALKCLIKWAGIKFKQIKLEEKFICIKPSHDD